MLPRSWVTARNPRWHVTINQLTDFIWIVPDFRGMSFFLFRDPVWDATWGIAHLDFLTYCILQNFPIHIDLFLSFRNSKAGLMAQSVKRPTLDFGLGHDGQGSSDQARSWAPCWTSTLL